MDHDPRLRRLLAAVLLLTLLCALLFVAAEADHHCPGEHCAVCAQLAHWGELLRTLSLLAGPFLLFSAGPIRRLSGRSAFSAVQRGNTPVSLCVKLSA